MRAQLARERRGFEARLRVGGDHVGLRLRLSAEGAALRLHRDDYALDARGEADARDVRAADGLREVVVASAAADCVLRAEVARLDFIGGLRVVVEAAHEALVENDRRAYLVEAAAELREVILAFVAEVFHDRGRALGDFLAYRALAVEDAQRVSVEAALAGVAELVVARAQVALERLAVDGAALGAADRVEYYLKVGKSEPAVELHREVYDLEVYEGVLSAERLDVELHELAVASLLRALVAEHRADAPELRGLRALVHLVLEVGADHRGGELRTERDAAAALVREGVHFLFDDVGRLADSAAEELRMLEDGEINFLISVIVRDVAAHLSHVGPFPRFVAEYVPRAARSLYCFHHNRLPVILKGRGISPAGIFSQKAAARARRPRRSNYYITL